MSLFTFGTKTTTGPAFSFASSSATPLTAGTGSGGRTALHLAALHGDIVAATELLRGGAAIDAVDKNGIQALHVAAAGDRAETCELLLAAGADIDCVDRAGDTALHLAAGCGGVATVRVLLGWGAARRVVNGRGKTARGVAQEKGWGGVVALLPDEGGARGRGYWRGLGRDTVRGGWGMGRVERVSVGFVLSFMGWGRRWWRGE
ncbi:uncharacterized protein LAJ45_04939 [Morchella importuna]|uniref:uncharacterized protein n=1 Tax=Morchella importuna TaxID=1174673 RepID=UPI001E8EA652|nr:uncharacterized protein LAJ45_04939 [Morchella importuna]KAH8150760.1 hypothetical protein LAJ45_04939 [Morchella importuna]